MVTEPRIGTHWAGCWKAHDDCCEAALRFLAEGAEVLMLDVLATDDEDPNALEMRHRLHLLGFTQPDQIDFDGDACVCAPGRPRCGWSGHDTGGASGAP